VQQVNKDSLYIIPRFQVGDIITLNGYSDEYKVLSSTPEGITVNYPAASLARETSFISGKQLSAMDVKLVYRPHVYK
jgi:hypothetical protein